MSTKDKPTLIHVATLYITSLMIFIVTVVAIYGITSLVDDTSHDQRLFYCQLVGLLMCSQMLLLAVVGTVALILSNILGLFRSIYARC